MRSPVLALSRSTADRRGDRRAEPGLLERLWGDEATRVLPMRRGTARVLDSPRDGPRLVLLPPSQVRPAPGCDPVYLGRDGGADFVAVEADPGGCGDDVAASGVTPAASPGGSGEVLRWASLRDVGALLGDRDTGLLVQAVALLDWHATHPHCPRCGAVTELVLAGWVRRCPRDGSEHYPRTDPAVIMAVVDGPEANRGTGRGPDWSLGQDRILLGHAPSWPAGRFSTLAGFVEPGESLEAAVRREVLEETGVVVGSQVSYRGSQPWPFPRSLMVGFQAVAVKTDVQVDGTEITDARWFTRAELADRSRSGELLLPSRVSIARHLVEDWFGSELPEPPEPPRA